MFVNLVMILIALISLILIRRYESTWWLVFLETASNMFCPCFTYYYALVHPYGRREQIIIEWATRFPIALSLGIYASVQFWYDQEKSFVITFIVGFVLEWGIFWFLFYK